MLDEIIKIAKDCGLLLKNARALQIEQKNHDANNLVTEYDVKIQEILRQKLLQILPEASFWGEEGEQNFERDGYCFICDPIDGTTNFIKDLKHSAVSIALLKNGKPILGVICNPYLDEVFWAEKGKGAFCNGEKITTSQEAPQNSLIVFGTAPYNRELSAKTWKLAEKSLEMALDVRRMGAAVLDLADVARGRFGMYWELILSPWDFAAGVLLVEEAGGKVMTIDGKNIDDYFAKSSIAALANDKFYTFWDK